MDENLLQIVIRAVDQASATLKGVQDSLAEMGDAAADTGDAIATGTKAVDDHVDALADADASFQQVSISAEQWAGIVANVERAEARAATEAIRLSGDVRGAGQAISGMGRAAESFVGGPAGEAIGSFTALTGGALAFSAAGGRLTALLPRIGASMLAFITNPAGIALAGVALLVKGLGALADAWQPLNDEMSEANVIMADTSDRLAAVRDEIDMLTAESTAIPSAIQKAWGEIDEATDKLLEDTNLAPAMEQQRIAILEELGVIARDGFGALPDDVQEPLRRLADSLRETLNLTTADFFGTGGAGQPGIGSVVAAALEAATPEIQELVERVLSTTLGQIQDVAGTIATARRMSEGAEPGTFVSQGTSGDTAFTFGGKSPESAAFGLEGPPASGGVPQQFAPMGGSDVFNNYGTVNVYVQQAGDVLSLVEALTGGG